MDEITIKIDKGEIKERLWAMGFDRTDENIERVVKEIGVWESQFIQDIIVQAIRLSHEHLKN